MTGEFEKFIEDQMTLEAKFSIELTNLCKQIETDVGYDLGQLYQIWGAKSECLKITEDLIKSKLPIESCLAVGLKKYYDLRPQDVSDMLEAILGWRLYQNVHNRNLWSWGRPPQHLGGVGQYWTWKASKDDFGPAIKAMASGNVRK